MSSFGELDDERDGVLAELKSHLKQRDAIEVHDNVEVKALGIFATGALSEGAVLVAVPFNECITVERIMSSALSPVFEASPGLTKYPDEVLALGLMYGRVHSECPWHHHCRSMPLKMDTPIFWSEDELGRTQQLNSFFVSNILKRQMAADWDSIQGPIAKQFPDLLGGVDMGMYEWALSMVYSRACGIKRKGVYTRCIAPVVDMANHMPRAGRFSADAFHFDDEKDVLQICTCVDVQAGDECFAIYGAYSNAKLLHTYGFVLPGEAPLAMDVWPNLSHHLNALADQDVAARKLKVLEQLRLTDAAADYKFDGSVRSQSRDTEVIIDPRLLRMTRIMQATDEELKLMCRPGYQGDSVGPRNEEATYKALSELFEAVRARLLSGAPVDDVVEEEGPALPPMPGAPVPSPVTEYRALCARTVRADDCLVLDLAARKAGAKFAAYASKRKT